MNKNPNESKSVLAQVMLPSHANPSGNVHGGEIMKMMDACGSVAATRHAKKNVVTVRVDELVFYTPISVGHLVTCTSKPIFVGRSSIEVKVEVKVEDFMIGEEKVALKAIFTYVALDDHGKPSAIPGLVLTDESEKKDYELGLARYRDRKKNQ